jgi:hypothetical protein
MDLPKMSLEELKKLYPAIHGNKEDIAKWSLKTLQLIDQVIGD